MQLLIKFLIGLTLFYAIERFCHRQTDGFQITKIHSNLTPSLEWETPPLNAEEESKIAAILAQPFTYLNYGGQCYAFLSEDKKVVLKFFKMHHLSSFQWIKHVCLPGKLDQYRLRLSLLQNEKLQRLFQSCHLAHSQLKEETGLIHLHLNSGGEKIYVNIKDKLNISHQLDLSTVPFVLQSYAENPFQKLRMHLKNNEILAAKSVVKAIVDCLIDRHCKRISDKDPALKRNIGLLKQRAIFIDIGSFAPAKRCGFHLELYKETRRMSRWLEKRSPELKAYLEELISEPEREKDQSPLLPTSLLQSQLESDRQSG